jgi:short-subunit dehydrogenase
MSPDENDSAAATSSSSSKFHPSPKAKNDFANKNILITGASGGLGRCLAQQLAKCSVSTLILSARSIDKLQTVAQECRDIASLYAPDTDLKVQVVKCDLTDTASVDNLGKEALQCCSDRNSGVVDVLINNGGISSRSDFVDTTIEVDEQLMQVNFLSGARLAKMVVPAMIRGGLGNNGGCIMWISSVQGLLGIPSRTSYASSKFAVQGYCEALRAELASSDVSVHVISPGYIRTDLSKSAITGDGRLYGKMDETTENGADPNEVAVAVLDGVAKRRSGKVGGSDFVVAAGLSAKIAIWLRLIAPGFLEKKLQKRYSKSKEKR